MTNVRRSGSIPGLPAIAEAGFPGCDVIQWFAMIAPAKTPPAIIRRLNAELVEMHRHADFTDRFVRQGLDPATGTPKELADFIQLELGRWARIFKETGVRAE